jgi:hypothetical protein
VPTARSCPDNSLRGKGSQGLLVQLPGVSSTGVTTGDPNPEGVGVRNRIVRWTRSQDSSSGDLFRPYRAKRM